MATVQGVRMKSRGKLQKQNKTSKTSFYTMNPRLLMPRFKLLDVCDLDLKMAVTVFSSIQSMMENSMISSKDGGIKILHEKGSPARFVAITYR